MTLKQKLYLLHTTSIKFYEDIRKEEEFKATVLWGLLAVIMTFLMVTPTMFVHNNLNNIGGFVFIVIAFSFVVYNNIKFFSSITNKTKINKIHLFAYYTLVTTEMYTLVFSFMFLVMVKFKNSETVQIIFGAMGWFMLSVITLNLIDMFIRVYLSAHQNWPTNWK